MTSVNPVRPTYDDLMKLYRRDHIPAQTTIAYVEAELRRIALEGKKN